MFPMSSWRGVAPIGAKALKGTAAMRPFLRMVGEASSSLQSRPRPHCHAGLCSGISIIPPKPGLPQPLLAGAHSPHPQRPAFDKFIFYLQKYQGQYSDLLQSG